MMTPPSDVLVTRLLWRDQLRALGKSLRYSVARLLRREPRWYITHDGVVIGRLVSSGDYADLLSWIGQTHSITFHQGMAFGRRIHADNQGHEADAGDAGPA